MTQEINQIVFNSMTAMNPLINHIELKDNILTYKDEEFNLQNFNLYTLFESYQLKLDFKNLNADELFEIIKLNAITFFSNEVGDY